MIGKQQKLNSSIAAWLINIISINKKAANLFRLRGQALVALTILTGGDFKPEYDGANINITAAGNYTISLDLSSGGNYVYILKKN